MKLLGCSKKVEARRELKPLCERSISKRSLLLETKAISMPEKKAEKAKVMMMYVMRVDTMGGKN